MAGAARAVGRTRLGAAGSSRVGRLGGDCRPRTLADCSCEPRPDSLPVDRVRDR